MTRVETEGEARLLIRAFMKHSAKNFKKAIEADDDFFTAAVLNDFVIKVVPHLEAAMKLVGIEIKEETSERTTKF